MAAPLWSPAPERRENSNLVRFMQRASGAAGRKLDSYTDLHSWSVNKIESFWELVWKESQLIHSQSYDTVLADNSMPGAKWFVGSRLNFAENLLRYRDDQTAIISWREKCEPTRLSYRQLHDSVASCAAGLRRLGVTGGDRVAAYLPNIAESVIAMLATTSLGALWSSCSPDFGLQGLLDRFSQIEPKVLFTANGYSYHGKYFDCLPTVRKIADRLPSMEQVVIIHNSDEPIDRADAEPVDSISWHELLKKDESSIEYAQLPFDHPVYIMYSSGTTGMPKCIVHGAGGTLLQHWKEHVLHTDLRREDLLFYYTTCGWMMWNWLVSALQVGATIFLLDGSPAYPDLKRCWDAIDAEKISVFGTSPKFLSSCQKGDIRPKVSHDLSSLKTILSTGAPLSAENFAWVYGEVKRDVQLSSISGGTDIISCFMLGNPMLPVYSEEIQCLGLGMKVESLDSNGHSLIGEVGELVCAAPFVSMPVSFWNDADGSKYRSAYFDYFPNVWHHGDFITITERGGVIVHGRSDATLNPGGVRIGTAEIYAPLESVEEVMDCIVVGQKWRDDVRVVLFVVLREKSQLDAELTAKIKQVIRKRATPRHIPALILKVEEIPYTLNGKKVELAVTQVIEGKEVRNRDALANPDALDQFATFPELQPEQ